MCDFIFVFFICCLLFDFVILFTFHYFFNLLVMIILLNFLRGQYLKNSLCFIASLLFLLFGCFRILRLAVFVVMDLRYLVLLFLALLMILIMLVKMNFRWIRELELCLLKLLGVYVEHFVLFFITNFPLVLISFLYLIHLLKIVTLILCFVFGRFLLFFIHRIN